VHITGELAPHIEQSSNTWCMFRDVGTADDKVLPHRWLRLTMKGFRAPLSLVRCQVEGVKSFAVRSPLHSMHGCAALGSAPGLAAISYLASLLAARASYHASLSSHIVNCQIGLSSISDESISPSRSPCSSTGACRSRCSGGLDSAQSAWLEHG
jgi:hypothetical protein